MSLKGLSVCVYCSASERIDPQYRTIGKTVGKVIADNGLNMVYGGGRLGIMGDVSASVLEHGGKVIGFIPEHLSEHEGANPDIQELYIVDSMHTRKLKMYERSNAFLILPGGFGTLDEFFEIMTWKQLGLHHKPLIILNYKGYWTKLVELMHHVIDLDFARAEHKFIFDVVESEEEFIHVLKKHKREMTLHDS